MARASSARPSSSVTTAISFLPLRAAASRRPTPLMTVPSGVATMGRRTPSRASIRPTLAA